MASFHAGDVISLVGAGGKTSIMRWLALSLPFPVIMTTTTHIGAWQIADVPQFSIAEFLSNPESCLASKEIWVSRSLDPVNKKIHGLDFADFSLLSREAAAVGALVLTEADGAALRHIKSPKENEPAVPPETTVLFHVTGLDVLGKPISSETVHRMDIFLSLTDARENDTIDDTMIVRNILNPMGGFKNCPKGCRRIAILNQADDPTRTERGNDIAQQLMRGGIDGVWVTRMSPIPTLIQEWTKENMGIRNEAVFRCGY